MTNQELLEQIKKLGGDSYENLRILEDGTIIGIGNLMFTRAIYMDMNTLSWGRRFCFKDPALADAEYKKITTGDDEPTGWIARR